MSLHLQPISLREARAFVDQWHRHHAAPQGGKFAVAVNDGSAVVGVAIVGRPVARRLDTGYVAEVTRCCVLEGHPNACSMLYAASWRAARAMGYRRLVTYSLPEESGVSLRASGWKCIGEAGGGNWNKPGRPRVDTALQQAKFRWEVESVVTAIQATKEKGS